MKATAIYRPDLKGFEPTAKKMVTMTIVRCAGSTARHLFEKILKMRESLVVSNPQPFPSL
jgi:hypothetical protein